MKLTNENGWKSGKLGDIAIVVMGQSPPGNSYNTSKLGIGLINGPTEFTNKYPVVRQWTSKPTKLCGKDDILLCVRGSSTGRMNISDGNYCIGRGIASISAIQEKGVTEFLYNLLQYKIHQILMKTAGSTFPNINSSEIRGMEIKIPPITEQQKIASILSTWDKAIELKEKLIEQKKVQKKGLMQKLLTGEVRLHGFRGEWKKVKLGDLSDISTGDKDNKDKVDNGLYPFFVRSENIERINSHSYDGEAILIPGDGRIGQIYHYINGKFDFHQRVYKISSFNDKCNGRYIYYYLKQFFYKEAMKYSAKATVDSLRMPMLTGMLISLPSLNEQLAIVNVLSFIDKRISLLDKELEALKLQKKGLMQLLLTGKVRVKV